MRIFDTATFRFTGRESAKVGGEPHDINRPLPCPRSLAGLDKREDSGLRFLPFHDLAAIWLRFPQAHEAHWDNQRPGDLMFGAWIRSDTGFDKHTGNYSGEPAESSRSELVLSVVICDEPKEGNWYNEYWTNIGYPEHGEVNSTDMPGYRCYANAIPLAQLADSASVDAALRTWCAHASAKLDTPIGLYPRHR
ncbi:hypothetical protein [Pseudomonas putida]|uniref:Uncharacterized protein n=1 Tax=Pseudomonas putida TaxID=303 RepID=A0A6I6XUL8_PSEPU|nr:hypothetical protein [Pseudomonas putida]QHG62962.1 hypothetical protein C2H86_00395 [Pseudomonas putida]